MCHTHDGCDQGHDSRHGDGSDKTLSWAMLAFGLLGLIQLAVALSSGRFALTVDGLHNVGEVPTLGINRYARRAEHSARKPVLTCWVLPLAPWFSSVLSVGGAIVLFAVADGYHNTNMVWLAAGLSLLSMMTNLGFARGLHAHHHDDDANSFAAIMHLAGDTLASGLAVIAYVVIGLTGGNIWADPAAGLFGALIIAYVHRKPMINSIREFRRHRVPGHKCNSTASAHSH